MKRFILVLVAFAVTGGASAGVREDWQAIADAVALAGQEEAAAQIEEAVDAISDADLERIYGAADLQGLAHAFTENGEAMKALDALATARMTAIPGFEKSPNFPNAVGYPSPILCPFSPDRSDGDALIIAVDAIQVSRVALESAKVIWSGLSRACGETIVILGAGGNTELACIPADIVLFAAELVVGAAQAVVDHIAFCDALVDSAEVEGSYERTGHIHSDLATHDADISAQVATHDMDLKVQVATHDADLKAQLATHDADLKAQLATHDAEIKALLENIQGTVDENQRLIKIFMSRQLEMMRLMITPEGRREVNADVLTCTGDDCPTTPGFQLCPNGSLAWNCK